MNEKGAILGNPGKYKNPPFLMLPGNPPLEEVTLYDFKVNQIPEPEDLNNIPEDYGKELVEVTQKKVKAYTYYCDLDADADWDDSIFRDGESHTDAEKQACLEARNKSGDGSKENPWKNLTWALECMEKKQCATENSCCIYNRLKCSGIAHYTACVYHENNIDIFNGKERNIIDSAKIEIRTSNCSAIGFSNFQSTIFCHCDANTSAANSKSDTNIYEYRIYSKAFSGCRFCMFYECNAKSEAITEDLGKFIRRYSETYAFDDCKYSTFFQSRAFSTGTNKAKKSDFDYYLFVSNYCISGCNTSIFYNCKTGIEVDGSLFNYCIYNCSSSNFYKCSVSAKSKNNGITGFSYCSICSFYECMVEISTLENSTSEMHGFSYNNNGNFYNCIVNININSYTDCYGFSYSENCNLYCCKAEIKIDLDIKVNGISSVSVQVAGFYQFTKSLYIHCDANVYVSVKAENQTGTNNKIRTWAIAEGWRSTENSTYLQCSYSISASAEATPNSKGEFEEYELECGIGSSVSCYEGYRCERRTQNGTESC